MFAAQIEGCLTVAFTQQTGQSSSNHIISLIVAGGTLQGLHFNEVIVTIAICREHTLEFQSIIDYFQGLRKVKKSFQGRGRV